MRNFNTLRFNKEFKRAYYRGISRSSSILVTYMVPNGKRECRVGITTSKKLGNAVCRNRCRRIIREAFLNLCPEKKPLGRDFVFVARSALIGKKMKDVQKQIEKQISLLLEEDAHYNRRKRKSKRGKLT